MTDINMTGADYIALLEEGTNIHAPRPSDTILTKQSDFKSDSESSPLSGLDGDGGANTEPHEEGKMPSDAPNVPTVASMDEPSRKAKIASNASGAVQKTKTKTDNGSKSNGSDKPWEKNTNKSSEDDDMAKNESYTMEDFDLEGVMDECGDQKPSRYMEDDMGMDDMGMDDGGADGGVSVTPEFLHKLMAGVGSAQLSDDAFTAITDAISGVASDGHTLDVGDIGDVMASLRDMAGSGSSEGEYDADEDIAHGDGEMAGDEGGPEYDGETQLMGDEDANESVTESRQQLDEAWLRAIPNVGNPREKVSHDGLDEDDVELLDIRRLAGM